MIYKVVFSICTCFVCVILGGCNESSKNPEPGVSAKDSTMIMNAFLRKDSLSKVYVSDRVWRLVPDNRYLSVRVHERTTQPIATDTSVLHKDAKSGLYELFAPTGSWYELTLPDKSKAWLNAGSALKFPVTMETDRKVELSGEGYLEVAKHTMPLYIQLGKSNIQMRTGKININTYNEAVNHTATVVAGQAILRTTTDTLVVSAGHCIRGISDRILPLYECDPEAALSWTQGMFLMDHPTESCLQVLERIHRWFDVSIIYNSSGKCPWNGKLPADTKIADFLKVLRINKMNYKYEIKNREIKIIVYPPI